MLRTFRHQLWPTSVSHPFPLHGSSLGLTGEKCYQKTDIPFFKLILQNFVFSWVFFLILFSIAVFSPYFVQVGLLLQCVALFQSGNWLSLKVIVNWCRVAVSNDIRLHRSNTAPRAVLVARATKISNAQKQPLRWETCLVTTWNT